jgi:hypothetical protein
MRIIGLLVAASAILAACGRSGQLSENSAPGDPKPNAASFGEYALSGPYIHDNLTVYLIHGPDKLKGKSYLTLQEALEKKLVIVHETGNVNELAIENISEQHEVYVQSGDIVKGGKQDRTFSMDFIAPARSGKMPVASFCVERGRWSKRGSEDLKAFSSSEFALANKSVKLAAKYNVGDAETAGAQVALVQAGRQANETPVQQETGQADAQQLPVQQQARTGSGQRAAQAGGQSAVWNAVAEEQRKLSANLGQSVQAAESASSYQLSLESQKLQEQTDAYIKALSKALEGKTDVVGYAFAINGKVNSADIYGNRELFQKLWPKLLRATATEAVSELKKDARFEPISAQTVIACMADAEKGQPTTRPAGSRVDFVMKESKDNLLFECRDKAQPSAWVHRNYVTK